jgi:hypothetical protein
VRAGRAHTARTALLGLVALSAAVVAGLLWAGAGAAPRPARVGAGPPPAVVDVPAVAPAGGARSWSQLLAVLDAARARAFATADPARLAAVYAPGAPALRRDRSALARLAGAGLRARGLRLVPVRVERISRGPARVRLRVVDELPGYRLVDASGAVVEVRPGRGRTSWTVTLERAEQRWLVYDVERG